MDVAQRVVGLVRSMRAKTNLKTRQPLSRIAVPASAETRRLIEQMNDVILEEINVKAIEFIDESSPIVRKTATAEFQDHRSEVRQAGQCGCQTDQGNVVC